MSEVVDLLSKLVAIASVNPKLVPGGQGEAAIADFCETWLAARGFRTVRFEAEAGRPSVVGVRKGTGGGGP